MAGGGKGKRARAEAKKKEMKLKRDVSFRNALDAERTARAFGIGGAGISEQLMGRSGRRRNTGLPSTTLVIEGLQPGKRA